MQDLHRDLSEIKAMLIAQYGNEQGTKAKAETKEAAPTGPQIIVSG